MTTTMLAPPMEAVRTDIPASELHYLLRTREPDRDDRWRSWAASLVGSTTTTAADLLSLWETVVDFDPILREHLSNPVDVGPDAVLVAGSGKETLKTFNVSTAAAILAAAAGAKVVKGVSASVSAVSGSADVLANLGIRTLDGVDEIGIAMARDGIAFVPYATFCPKYAGEYDDVFTEVNPFSFMMPIAVLAVRARSFVYGIADSRVQLSAEAIMACRPDLERGSVVMTEPMHGEMIDELATYGRAHLAIAGQGSVESQERVSPEAPRHWVRAVAHGDDHQANADRFVAALAAHNVGPGCNLVEENAALILRESTGRSGTLSEARRTVQRARTSGQAQRLLTTLQGRGL
jgi:anthranilate phosphoribosyltransferase